MRQKEKGAGCASDSRPLDAPDMLETGGTERERTAIEKDGTTGSIELPQSTAIGATFAWFQQITMLIDVSELEQTVVCDDELLIHEVTSTFSRRQRHCLHVRP